MKKVLITIALFIGAYSQAQQEVSVDLGDALIMKTLEFSYEYYLEPQSSIGISALFNFEKRSADFRYNEKRMITPFFRHYFTTNQNWVHFGEVFFGINTGEDEVETNGITGYEDYTDGALGISVGSKYISNGGFVVTIYGGIGRNMFSAASPIIVPRVGLNLGYRF